MSSRSSNDAGRDNGGTGCPSWRGSAVRSPARPARRRTLPMPGSPASLPIWSPRCGWALTLRQASGRQRKRLSGSRADLARLHGRRAEGPSGADIPATTGCDDGQLGYRKWHRTDASSRKGARASGPIGGAVTGGAQTGGGAAPTEGVQSVHGGVDANMGGCIHPYLPTRRVSSSNARVSNVRRIGCPERADQAVDRTAEEASLTGMSPKAVWPS